MREVQLAPKAFGERRSNPPVMNDEFEGLLNMTITA